MNEQPQVALTDAEYFGMAFIYVHKETSKVKVLNVDVAKQCRTTHSDFFACIGCSSHQPMQSLWLPCGVKEAKP